MARHRSATFVGSSRFNSRLTIETVQWKFLSLHKLVNHASVYERETEMLIQTTEIQIHIMYT